LRQTDNIRGDVARASSQHKAGKFLSDTHRFGQICLRRE
jgi:hypothetical protein